MQRLAKSGIRIVRVESGAQAVPLADSSAAAAVYEPLAPCD